MSLASSREEKRTQTEQSRDAEGHRQGGDGGGELCVVPGTEFGSVVKSTLGVSGVRR